MNLSYKALVIVEGEKIVEILLEDIKEEEEKWQSALIVYVVGTKPTINATDRFINSQNVDELRNQKYSIIVMAVM